MYKVLIALTKFTAIKDRMNGDRRSVLISEVKRDRNSMRMELGGIVVRLEKGDVEDGMQTREVRRETKVIMEHHTLNYFFTQPH